MVKVTDSAKERFAQILASCDEGTVMRVKMVDGTPRLIEDVVRSGDELFHHGERIVLALDAEAVTALDGHRLNAIQAGDDTLMTLE